MSERVDRFGAVASSLCAAHCALCALLPAAFGALGLGFLLGHEAEWLFTLVAVGFAAGALFLGWRQHHSLPIAGLLAIGILGLFASRGLEMSSGHHGDHGHHHGHHEENHQTAFKDHGDAHHEEHGHHGDAHHEHGHADAVGKEAAGYVAEDAHLHGAHDGWGHQAGTVVGVLAGLFLLFGHILNIRAARACREPCCP